MLEINTYFESDRNEVIALILHCQNDGTRPLVSIENQPELLHIKEKFIDGGGNFWVAKENGMVAGCVGLMKADNGIGILKKFFVYEPYRGKPYHLGCKLYETLLSYAETNGMKRIILDTPQNTERAHYFYKKAGFLQIDKEQLPVMYDYPYEDSDFFCLKIRSV